MYVTWLTSCLRLRKAHLLKIKNKNTYQRMRDVLLFKDDLQFEDRFDITRISDRINKLRKRFHKYILNQDRASVTNNT